MKFKKISEKGPAVTQDTWYDLTIGGYIKPEDMLEEVDAIKVKKAIKLIQQFLEEAEKSGHLEQS